MSKPTKKTSTDNRLTYFLLSRSIFDSPIWCDDPHALKIFIYLLGTARHDKKPKRYPGFNINRGELVTSLTLIAENNSFMMNGVLKTLSKQKVMRILNLLEKQGYIKRISDTYGTHVSICNYDIYQNPDTYKSDATGTGVEQEWNATGTGVETNNNDNNVNNDNNDKQIKVFMSRISKLFNRRETTEWIKEEKVKLNNLIKRKEFETELKDIENLYNSEFKYKRKNIITFLNNWTGELDKAMDKSNYASTSIYQQDKFKLQEVSQ